MKISVLKNKTNFVLLAMLMFVLLICKNNYARYIVVHNYEDTLSFVGDIYPRESTTIKAYKKEGGIKNVLHESYEKILEESDFVVGNLECCISEQGEAYEKQYTFRVNPENKKLFKEAKIDLLTVANNHSMDFGAEALKDTLKYLEETDVGYVGVGNNDKAAMKPYEKFIDNRKYVIYGASAVVPTYKWFAKEDGFGMNSGYNVGGICAAVKKKKKEEPNSTIIVYMHWGKEKELLPNDFQKDAAKKFVDAGCDLVVGSHPHVIQNIEYYKGVPIVYSLGNFIYGETNTETLVLDVKFDYSTENKTRAYLKIHPGESGFERVKLLGYQQDRDAKVNYIVALSPTCEINEDGYIYEKRISDTIRGIE